MIHMQAPGMFDKASRNCIIFLFRSVIFNTHTHLNEVIPVGLTRLPTRAIDYSAKIPVLGM